MMSYADLKKVDFDLLLAVVELCTSPPVFMPDLPLVSCKVQVLGA